MGGEPGPWGSDPKHTFTGIDTISRDKNNFGDYGAHYEVDLSSRVREELFGSFFLDNNGFTSPYGFSFDKDLRGQGEARTIVSVSSHYTVAFGVAAGREEVKNTFITDANFDASPSAATTSPSIWRTVSSSADDSSSTPACAANGFARRHSHRRIFAAVLPRQHHPAGEPQSLRGLLPHPGTRLHASFGTGIRPPTGFELAFTDNPQLKPERTRSVDAGMEQRLFGSLSLDATYFYNRYYDLIVTLGGSLAALSHYQSANLANSRAQGAEFSATLAAGALACL